MMPSRLVLTICLKRKKNNYEYATSAAVILQSTPGVMQAVNKLSPIVDCSPFAQAITPLTAYF
jgi:hypothetical protein